MPFHDLVEKMSDDIIEILSTVHALTGCDTTSKIGTKEAALKTANVCGYEHLCFFGKHELMNDMFYNAEQFLLRFVWRFKIWCLPQKALRVWFRQVSSDKQSNKRAHIMRLFAMSFMSPCTIYWRNFNRASSIWIQFKWRRWLAATNRQWHINSCRFPSQCNYLKCARSQGCPCRIKQIACSQYCKCEAKQSCKNTSSCWWIIMQDQFISHISCWYFQNNCIFIWEKCKNNFLSDKISMTLWCHNISKWRKTDHGWEGATYFF